MQYIMHVKGSKGTRWSWANKCCNIHRNIDRAKHTREPHCHAATPPVLACEFVRIMNVFRMEMNKHFKIFSKNWTFLELALIIVRYQNHFSRQARCSWTLENIFQSAERSDWIYWIVIIYTWLQKIDNLSW